MLYLTVLHYTTHSSLYYKLLHFAPALLVSLISVLQGRSCDQIVQVPSTERPNHQFFQQQLLLCCNKQYLVEWNQTFRSKATVQLPGILCYRSYNQNDHFHRIFLQVRPKHEPPIQYLLVQHGPTAAMYQ